MYLSGTVSSSSNASLFSPLFPTCKGPEICAGNLYSISISLLRNLSGHLSRRGDDGEGGKILLLSHWNTAMHESNATCTVQQRSHPMINVSPDPDASVHGGNPQSSSFEEAAYIKTNAERAYGKAQSRGGDANTVLEVVSGFLLYGVSVSLEQCVFMQEGK